MALEERVSRLEGAYEQVNRRLDDLNRNVASLRSEVSSPWSEVREEFSILRREMNRGFSNMYVLIGGVWATLVAGFVALSLAVLNVN